MNKKRDEWVSSSHLQSFVSSCPLHRVVWCEVGLEDRAVPFPVESESPGETPGPSPGTSDPKGSR